MNQELSALSQVDTVSTAMGSLHHELLPSSLEPRVNPYYFGDSQSFFNSDPHEDLTMRDHDIDSSVKEKTLDPWIRSYHEFLRYLDE